MARGSVATLRYGPGGDGATIRASGPGAVVLLPRNGREAPPREVDSPPAMTKRRIKVTAWRCKCERCGHEITVLEPPNRCPNCTARNWLEPPRWRRPDKAK
jgi:hypothetical protein